jgi:hypothetical protein
MTKSKFAIAGLAALALTGIPALAQGGPGGPGGQPGGQTGILERYIASLPLQTIDAAERADLVAMRQEEKVARDVYTFLGTVWGMQSFTNIAQSEQSHMDLVKLILDRYGIADPLPNENLGTYGDPFFYGLFEALVIFGLQSPLHALVVGELIEDFDIVDLQQALTRTDNRDLGTVWQNLYRGSRNHLRAFFDQLAVQNYTYLPIFLSPADYVAITTSDTEARPVDENGDPLR